LERLLRGAFRQRRKTVWNALRGAGFPEEGVRAALAAVGLEERLRPQQIPPEAWLEFSRRPEIGNAVRLAEKHDREKGRP
jgi:16S rRNA A1518/A1519 N6-dimethyltransferase RsmA/KsgA/DIM1 with predicted DNA glycosylase/AP lyase activity